MHQGGGHLFLGHLAFTKDKINSPKAAYFKKQMLGKGKHVKGWRIGALRKKPCTEQASCCRAGGGFAVETTRRDRLHVQVHVARRQMPCAWPLPNRLREALENAML